MPRKKESYESLTKKIETIISTMESEELSLEKSIQNYEKGIEMCNKLYTMLNEAEGRVKILTQDGEKDFIKVDELYE